MKVLVDQILVGMSPTFDAMYAARGRPSVPPERLLKAMLLMALFTVRSERLFAQQLHYNMLFMWFLDMDLQEKAFDHSVFSHNQERFLAHEVVAEFFARVVEVGVARELMSSEHFSVDGTLIEAWGSVKSFRPKDDDSGDNNGFADFKGTKRSNETHESKTDPDAKLFRKGMGKEAKLSYMGHALMENRNGLIADIEVTPATGTAEREAAKEMLEREQERRERRRERRRRSRRRKRKAEKSKRSNRTMTVGADKAYDTKKFVDELRELGVTPHVAQNANSRRSSSIDERTTRHPGYGMSQTCRMAIERIFGWMKGVGGVGRTRYRGLDRTASSVKMAAAAYNVLRIAKLQPAIAG